MGQKYYLIKSTLEEITNKTKVCSVCRDEKDISCFGVDRSRKDSKNSACKECIDKRKKRYHKERKTTDEEFFNVDQEFRHLAEDHTPNNMLTGALQLNRGRIDHVNIDAERGLKVRETVQRKKSA